METITIAIISTVGVIITTIIQNSSKSEIKKIETKIDKVHIESLKNFIVRTLSDLEKRIEIDESVKGRLYEAYDTYTKTYNGNSYIHSKWEKLRKDGKL